MTNFEKYFPGRKIDEFKGMTGLVTNNKIRDCDHCPSEKMCAADRQGHTCWGIFVKWAKTKIKQKEQ